MSSAQLAPGTAIETFTVSGIARNRVGATTYDATDASGAAAQVTVYDGACFPSALVLERSLRELRQLQTVAHPRVARVLGCGKLAGGGTWEAHAPLPPQSLAEHLAAGALAEADAIAIASQIGDALIEAQKVGVIHRSLGADVVFPSPNGVVVAGFAVGAPHGGKSFGPLDTIAPEQVEGKVVDQRTLIYNLAALLHGMLRGAPLFVGDSASILQAHLTQEPGADVAPALRRGLAKDPRVRPMMLRQFVTEITQGVGAAVTDSGAPTSRGWTMFTSDSPTPPAATPAAAAAPAAKPAPAPVSPPPPMADAAQPSTRGWTMFMQAADGGDAAPASEPATASAATPAPVATPTPAAVAPAAPAAGAKPSTRGWTMFMQAADDPAPASEAAGPSPNVVVTTTAAAAPAPAATPSAAAPAAPPVAATAPSSRGWTMFTSAADAEEPAPTAAASPAPAAPIDATVVAHAPTAGDPAKPSTRGWTMFTRDDEAPPTSPAAAAAASASAATPVEPVPDGADGGPPSSRGWTMFMEPGAAAAAAGAAGAPAVAASSAASSASSTPTPAATLASEAEAPAGGQRRGWTMFMEAPIASAPQAQFGPTGAAPSPEPTPAPAPAVDASSSDNRGWTVFGAPAPSAAAPDTATAEGRTVVVTPTPVAHDASEGPTASGQVTSSEAPEPAPGRGRTVVAAGVTAVPGSVGVVTGRTVFPSAQPAMPDTQYFRRGDIPPERPTSRTTAVDVHAPAGRPPVEERDASPRAPVPALGEPNIPERTGGSKTAILVVVGVGVIGTIVALVAWPT